MSLADPFQSPTPTEALAALGYGAPPDADGWLVRNSPPVGRFDDHFLSVEMRCEGAKARMRVDPDMRHANMNNVVHGAFLLSLIDYALFAGPVALGVGRVLGGATIETSTQFYGPVTLDRPINLILEVMRETGRLVFSRGVIDQDGQACVGFSGTIRRRNAAEAAARIRAWKQANPDNPGNSGP
jgi:acyl-coenzyme A thioesterase PaaI-like protein